MGEVCGIFTDFSVYLTKEFLENTSENNKFFKCYKGEELRAAVVMVVDDENKKSISSNFLIYSGICYGQPTNNQSKSQQISERFELTSFIIQELTEIYQSFQFQLSPTIKDIRPFQWHNYGHSSEDF